MEVKDILKELRARTTNGHKKFYHPLPQEDSTKIKEWYASRLWSGLSLEGNDDAIFCNGSSTIVATGYDRVVIGDYGPYIEFDESHINLSVIKPRWPGKPYRKVKYIWMQTQDAAKTKVYHQQATVGYADYKVGKYYADPSELRMKEGDVTMDDTPYIVWSGKLYDVWSKV